jgi:hypothetical protein
MPEAMLNELRQEAEITQRLLDRVPPDKLEWRPHPKSMSLGQLALHVASIPGDLARLSLNSTNSTLPTQTLSRRCRNRKRRW